MAVLADTLEIRQALAGLLDTLVDKAIGPGQLELVAEVIPVQAVEVSLEVVQGILPTAVVPGVGKHAVNPVLAGFFRLQQEVGDTGVGRDHKYPLVEVLGLAAAE